MEVTKDMESFKGWDEERNHRSYKWTSNPGATQQANLYTIHVPWVGICKPEIIQTQCERWISRVVSG